MKVAPGRSISLADMNNKQQSSGSGDDQVGVTSTPADESDSADDQNSTSSQESEPESDLDDEEMGDLNKEGDFVLVQFLLRPGRKPIHYIGHLEGEVDEDGNWMVQFMRRKQKSNQFHYPQVTDRSETNVNQIIRKLSPRFVRRGIYVFRAFPDLDLR